jgi:anti-sigma regulatory factor (Ser/Thr protein kinase)
MPLGTERGSSRARAFARDCLNHWNLSDESAFGQDAILVVSELVTNALLHAETAEELRLTWQPPRLVVEVQDTGPGTPRVCRPNETEPGRRGLAIVTYLAHRWRIVRGPGRTKTIRVELVHGC